MQAVLLGLADTQAHSRYKHTGGAQRHGADSDKGVSESFTACFGGLAGGAHFLVDDLDCAQDLPPCQGAELRVPHILQGVDCLQWRQATLSRCVRNRGSGYGQTQQL